MCERYSWLNVDGKTVFLTGRDVFHTKRGRELQRYSQRQSDWYGHGAIRWYYGIEHDIGVEHECTDFSTPRNFPADLVDAIKAGEMWEFGVTDEMRDMLSKRAGAACDKACDEAWAKCSKAWAAYNKACDEAWAACDKACDKARAEAWAACDKARDEAWAACDKACDKARDAYNKARDEAWAAYDKACAEARAARNKARVEAFVTLFAEPKNRIKAWR